MVALYPLLFEDNFHVLVWGGNRLKSIKGLPVDDVPIGESWEVSAVEKSKSVVRNGVLKGMDLNSLTRIYGKLLLGESVYKKYGENFPLLVKFIDAAKDLSVQVHPNNEIAMRRHNVFGKSELWYIMKAEPDSKIYVGFNSPISKYEYTQRIENGTICDVLQEHRVKAGDVFYIPAGRVHAICGGIMLAEIQQTSDLTYRIFDYNRPGLDGKPRELHTEWARDALDYTVYNEYKTCYERKLNEAVSVIANDLFVVNLFEVNGPVNRALYKHDSFVIYMCLEGNCSVKIKSTKGFGDDVMPEITEIALTEGNSCLIPASVADVVVTPCNGDGITRLLEVYIDEQGY